MDITCNNFTTQYAAIEKVINNASFVAVDLEFLGLEDEEIDKKCSLFDTPQERYEKTLHSVRRFPPAQLGLSFFTALDDGERYKVDVFTFYLFKSVTMGSDYSFSIASLSFLGEHGFDFNKLTREGITHSNLDELTRILNRFHQPNGIEIFGHQMPPLLHHLTRIIRHEVARARRKSTGSEGAQQHHFPGIPIAISQKLTELQRAALLYKLHGCTPGVKCILKDQVMMVVPSTERASVTKKALFEQLTTKIMGVSDIVLAMIEKKLPIIGHNSFRDLLYMYENFVADLPDTLEEFKRTTKCVFPCVADTKILAEECKNRLSTHGVMNYRLESLNAFFERMATSRRIACPVYVFDANVADKFRNPEASTMHDAGVDAVSTGQTFIRLAHLISMEDRDCSTCLPFKTLVYSIRPLANRLPVPLLGVPYINLLGDEPPSRNPDAIILEMIASEDEDGLEALRKELRGKFGRWRCDVRRHNDNRIHVATNTDTTYWRVYHYYSMHPQWRVLSVPSIDSSSVDLSSSPPYLRGSTQSVSSTGSGFSSDGEGPLVIADEVTTTETKNNHETVVNDTFRLTARLLDVTPVPALKWWFAACTCIVAANVVGRRSITP